MGKDRLFEIGDISPARYFISISIAMAFAMAILTRDELAGLALPRHFLQWILQVSVSMGILIGCHMLLHRYVWFTRLNPWLRLLLSGFIGGMIYTIPSLLIDFGFGNDPWPNNFSAARSLWLDELDGSFWLILLCWVGINAPWVMGLRLQRPGPTPAEPKGPPPEPPPEPSTEPAATAPDFVPEHIAAPLLYLKSELQYLNVVTELGDALILGSLKSAVDTLPPGEGLQVHRSWWVAFRAIQHFERQGRQGELQLLDGTRVPVSRANLARVAAAVGE